MVHKHRLTPRTVRCLDVNLKESSVLKLDIVDNQKKYDPHSRRGYVAVIEGTQTCVRFCSSHNKIDERKRMHRGSGENSRKAMVGYCCVSHSWIWWDSFHRVALSNTLRTAKLQAAGESWLETGLKEITFQESGMFLSIEWQWNKMTK